MAASKVHTDKNHKRGGGDPWSADYNKQVRRKQSDKAKILSTAKFRLLIMLFLVPKGKLFKRCW